MNKNLTRAGYAVAGTATLVLLQSSPALAAGVPDPTPGLPAGVKTKIDTLLGAGMALVIAACVAGFFICGWKLALAVRHGETSEVAGKLGAVAGACILVGTASGIVTYLYG